ncbi:MAG: peptide-methionine (S)-S-oxide reductase [Gammaproteobacteria bacterium]|nr:peptide-methionine (S)-S-oxide reductase [Gammaproteobacteria bacterium]|tara:strand:- start:8755 stop:9408 length:654 start_codon:yes stop_codon:yes gene_type:complete
MLFGMSKKPVELPSAETALQDRAYPNQFTREHFVNGHPIVEPLPDNLSKAVFGLGCFWGAERLFWKLPGVFSTAVGYAGGITKNPTYEDVCSGKTGHTEVVKVFYDPTLISYEQLLAAFWESHDPTQGMRQGNDMGTQYRSAIYCIDNEQSCAAKKSLRQFQQALIEKALGAITTEIRSLREFYYAEDYHQQYLAKNPGGYCGLAGTGVCYTLNSNS